MFGIPILAAALLAVQAAASNPAAGEQIGADAFSLRLPDGQHTSVSMSIAGAPQTLLMIYCDPRSGLRVASAVFPDMIGGGGMFTPIRYSFDGGEEHRGQWVGAGSRAAMTPPRDGTFGDFLRALRSSRSVRFTASRRGGGRQEASFSYADPGSMLDELNRRCGLNL